MLVRIIVDGEEPSARACVVHAVCGEKVVKWTFGLSADQLATGLVLPRGLVIRSDIRGHFTI